MGNQPSETIVTGIRSIGNSTRLPLGISQTFTGRFEDVTNVAVITILVKSDKNSAIKGLKFQWSVDGAEIDFEDASDLGGTSGLSGRAFAITPRGDFFRIVYVNGFEAQTKFRLGVTYHSAGAGLITRPLDRVLTDNNFAQTVRAVLTAKKSNGEYVSVRCTDDGILLTDKYHS